ncbi:hypothetical protein GCM10009836_14270 [Pseudonocardia ailaonensis]|uniref:Uncharacterized protein n=1 Tax=Pseudonocardia ailaonensis TaxID=367279 RepID=A0ABN2MTE2_9PSEU
MPFAVALGACSTAAPTSAHASISASAPVPAAPAPTTVPQAAPTGTPLLWPVTDVSAAQQLQTSVDGGAQPWTLDPEEVALNYAGATWSWTNPTVTQTAPGRLDLTNPGGGTAHLTLVQPVRAGTTGIWVVSQAQRT